MRPVLLLVPLAITSAACADPDRAPTAASSGLPTTGAVLAARAKPVANTRATFAYYTVTSSGTGGRLVGDGLAGDGLPSPGLSIYKDGSCDVSAEIFVSGSGDATMDPTGGNTPCTNVRELIVEFGTALGTPPGGSSLIAEGAFFTNVRDVHSLAAGANDERRFRLLLRGFAGCDYLRYENVEGSDGRHGTSDDVSFGTIIGKSIRVTRLPDENGKRRWLAESQPVTGGAHAGAHVAFCERVAKPGSTYLGAYDIPFKLEVREQ